MIANSRLVRNCIESLHGRIELAYLPPYAPELNPVEYIWAHWKHHELPNVCPKDYWQLSEAARRTLRRMRRRPRLITVFWKQSSLWPDLPYIMRASIELHFCVAHPAWMVQGVESMNQAGPARDPPSSIP